MPTDKTTVERLPKGRVVCTVIFDEAEYAPAETAALARFAERIKIDGFRAGHAPADMIRSKVGDDDLFEESIRQLLKTSIPALAKDHNIAPVIPPKVEAVSRLPVTLKITFVEKPEVTVKKPDDLTIAKKEPQVEAKDIEKVVASVLQEQRTVTLVDRAAKEGDQVTMDFRTTGKDGKEIEGLHAVDYEAVIGSDTLLPGFEKELVGLRAGESKTFTLTLPEKFAVAELQKKPADFHVTVKKVEEVQLPELTDEFAKAHLHADSVDAFKKMVEESMKGQEEQFLRMQRERELMEEIKKRTSVEIADELLDEEVRGMVEEWSQQLEKQGKTIAQALEAQKKTPEQAEKELREQALDRWKLRLGIAKLIELRKVEVSPEELEQGFKSFLSSLPPEQRDSATGQWQAGSGLFEEIRWRTMVDKLISELLA